MSTTLRGHYGWVRNQPYKQLMFVARLLQLSLPLVLLSNGFSGVGLVVASAAPDCSSLQTLARDVFTRCNYAYRDGTGGGRGARGSDVFEVLNVDFATLWSGKAISAASRSALRQTLLKPLTCAPLQSSSPSHDLRDVCTYANSSYSTVFV